MMDLTALAAPLPAAEIEWRVGSTNSDKTSGLALAYLTARHIMDRLDEVCGPANWQDRYEFHGPRTICYLSLRIGDEWITKADGAGDSDVEAEKGAISDALKRAAVKWGIGRYLYDVGNIWVKVVPAGRSLKIDQNEYPRLEKLLRDKFGVSNSRPSQERGEPPKRDERTLSEHLKAIEAETTLAGCQAEFAEAWKQCPASDARAKIKAAYEARKLAITQPDLSAKFDAMEKGGERHPSEYLRA